MTVFFTVTQAAVLINVRPPFLREMICRNLVTGVTKSLENNGHYRLSHDFKIDLKKMYAKRNREHYLAKAFIDRLPQERIL